MTASPDRRLHECPHCGADLPQGTLRCRACGASDQYDWGDTTGEFSVGAYGDDDDFDYDDFVAREFGTNGRNSTPDARNLWVRAIILGLVISLLLPLIVRILLL